MKPPTKVLLQVAPTDTGVKTLYEVFSWGQEAQGEYLFYGEIDANAVKPDGTGDLSQASVFAEVAVTFESDALSAAQADIQNYLRANKGMAAFSFEGFLNDADRGNSSPAQTCALLSPVHELVIDVCEHSYRRLAADNSSPFVVFYGASVDRNRVTEITVSCSNEQANLRWLWEKFDWLCREYAAIPFVRFTGAIRE